MIYKRTLTIDPMKHDVIAEKVDLLINGKNINEFASKIECEIMYDEEEKDKFNSLDLGDKFELTEEVVEGDE